MSFFSPVPKSSTRTGLICVKNPLSNISCLGPFKSSQIWSFWGKDFLPHSEYKEKMSVKYKTFEIKSIQCNAVKIDHKKTRKLTAKRRLLLLFCFAYSLGTYIFQQLANDRIATNHGQARETRLYSCVFPPWEEQLKCRCPPYLNPYSPLFRTI
jgi:hypothetical protein